MGVDILKEYNDIYNLLKEFYENDVSFNMNSFVRTLRDLSGKNINDKYESQIYHIFKEDNDNDNIEMFIAFGINDTFLNMYCEVARIIFEFIYIDEEHNSDVKILNIDIKESYLNL